MSVGTRATVYCDYADCEATMAGRDILHARMTADRAGWYTGAEHGTRDYCPLHKPDRDGA